MPVGRYLEIIAEGSMTLDASATNFGFVGGVAVKSFRNVTIPIVLAARPVGPDERVQWGLLGVFAHVGFQL